MAVTTSVMPAGAAGWLTDTNPSRVVLVIPCSAAKARGGQPRAAAAGGQAEPWPEALLSARARVLGRSDADVSRVMPAWRRYEGGFYRHARLALGEAAAAGNLPSMRCLFPVSTLSGTGGNQPGITGNQQSAWYARRRQRHDRANVRCGDRPR